MAASEAISSFGTLLKIGDGGGTESFTTIAEVRDISGPGFEQGTEEVTHHTSPGRWKERIATLLDAGEVTFELNFLPAETTHSYSSGLLEDMVNGTKRNFQLVFPDTGATTWTFPAIVANFEPTAPVEGKLTADVTLEISGAPTLA